MMRKHHYNDSIKIISWEGTRLDMGNYLEEPAWTQFKDRQIALLDILSETPTGRKLFTCIRGTGKKAMIYCGSGYFGSVTQKDPPTETSGIASSIVTFRPAQKNMTLSVKGTRGEYQQAKQKETEYGEENSFTRTRGTVLQQMRDLHQPTTIAEAIPELGRVLQRAHLGMALEPALTKNRFRNPTAELPKRLGINPNKFLDMIAGLEKIPDDIYYSLCFLLYDYLTPGTGVNAAIRMANTASFLYSCKDLIKAETTRSRNAATATELVEAVTLGHELIHAWRMMAGRRVVVNGWEEEAKTSGIGPFSQWQMTENSFRADLKLSKRKDYTDPTCSSELMIGIRDATNAGHYRGVQF